MQFFPKRVVDILKKWSASLSSYIQCPPPPGQIDTCIIYLCNCTWATELENKSAHLRPLRTGFYFFKCINFMPGLHIVVTVAEHASDDAPKRFQSCQHIDCK